MLMRKIVLATRNTVIRTPTRDQGNRNKVCLITEVKAAAYRLCSHVGTEHRQLHVQKAPDNPVQGNTFHDTVNLHSAELHWTMLLLYFRKEMLFIGKARWQQNHKSLSVS